MRVVAGSARSINLITPKGEHTRPTTDRIKETLFNIIQGDIPDCTFLDLFAGSGGIGIEALSRGANKAVFVDNDRSALDCIKENLRLTKLFPKAEVIGLDALRAITRLGTTAKGSFDIIFMDPPYAYDYSVILDAIERSGILAPSGFIIAEADIENDVVLPAGSGLEIFRIKDYKSNRHIFITKRD